MKTADLYPSKWLKCSDLMGRSVAVTIDRVELEDLGDGEKPVVYFQGKGKGLVLNRTNALSIEEMLGDETDNWTGGRIALVPAKTMYQGKRVDCIRVEATSSEPPARPAPKPAPPEDDNIPF